MGRGGDADGERDWRERDADSERDWRFPNGLIVLPSSTTSDSSSSSAPSSANKEIGPEFLD